MPSSSLHDLLIDYDRALAYSHALTADLTDAEVRWRADSESSAIGWHLGHQAAVAHFMVRNLTAAEPPVDAAMDRLMDSATPERDRGDLPDLTTITAYRAAVAERVHFRLANIDSGNVGAPDQLRSIAKGMVTALINHEYQHAKWIGEVRSAVHQRDLPDDPTSELLTKLDGYLILAE